MERASFATKEEFWRLQETLNELSATQMQHADRIMRLEKRSDDATRSRSVWGPASPFPAVLGSQHESTLNPAAEAFRNFDADTGAGMISSLSLDNTDDSRRAAASRANSVRFDESANNHYGASRQSIELPTRTGSGLGSHPLSERSLSHRSDGRASNSGFGRTNSFGLEQSRLLGSIHNSPRVSGNPPPGFFILGPCPSIIRCWLTESFSLDSLMYAAVCTGSSSSSIGLSLVQNLGLVDNMFEEGGMQKIKVPVYLTEAKIQFASSRSASPAPQVPTLIVKFLVNEQPQQDRSIQIILGSDVLRARNADILFSQDKLMIFDDDRNQLSIPLVRPEDDSTYKSLSTASRSRTLSMGADSGGPFSSSVEPTTPGIIGRPGRLVTQQPPESPTMASPSAVTSAAASEPGDLRRTGNMAEPTSRSSIDLTASRANEDSKSTTGSEKSYTTPASKSSAGVWAKSWRAESATQPDPATAAKSSTSTWARPSAPRPMKVLRPGKSTAGASRSTSSSTPFSNGSENVPPIERKPSQSGSTDAKSGTPGAATSNPIGSASAFGWLKSGQPRKATANGGS